MITWRAAMERALYGPDGFYRREHPEAHFRTSVHASPLFARALAGLLAEVDARLGRPDRLDVVDMGAGCASLLTGIREAAPRDVARRMRTVAVEVEPRGGGEGVVWATEPPEGITGLVVANEWLDNVPLDIVEYGPGGPRLMLVDTAGNEQPGPEPAEADLAWLARWWPERTGRAEIGRSRDEAWAWLVGRMDAGVAVAVDYAHDAATRRPTLAGYRDGRSVWPVPDGSCDVTAHVALDSCAVPGLETVLTTQREALHALGVDGRRPPRELAVRDPRGYVAALSRAGEAAELTDPGGLGGFGWLMQAKEPAGLDFFRT
ncbi:SAM-dependent methyltransferase [Actinocorallia libanotica]|uniref:SAM-dependent methyltransferase n=1 Tax=Actinocorallia libanotica TaxID=46162 RepID=A0ABP4C9N3_9ACTN